MSSGRIPKSDPLEGHLQDMLRYNMEKYAGQALDTIGSARRVRELLSVHNIGQRLFAKYVLGLSQGTVSELLSKPKSWEKLTEKGRDSYRKMHAWAYDENAIMLLKSLIPRKGELSRPTTRNLLVPPQLTGKEFPGETASEHKAKVDSFIPRYPFTHSVTSSSGDATKMMPYPAAMQVHDKVRAHSPTRLANFLPMPSLAQQKAEPKKNSADEASARKEEQQQIGELKQQHQSDKLAGADPVKEALQRYVDAKHTHALTNRPH